MRETSLIKTQWELLKKANPRLSTHEIGPSPLCAPRHGAAISSNSRSNADYIITKNRDADERPLGYGQRCRFCNIYRVWLKGDGGIFNSRNRVTAFTGRSAASCRVCATGFGASPDSGRVDGRRHGSRKF